MSNFAESNANFINIMVSKTRERLIEVAKQLFTYKGVENTTMNDIAAASDKGRRTIYTYFKNKREIYNAVVEQQGRQLVGRLQSIVDLTDVSCTEKLNRFLLELFDIIAQSSPRPEGYRRLLLRDHKRVTKIYRVAIDNERTLLETLLRQGVESGEFDRRQADRLPAVITFAITSALDCHAEDGADPGTLAAQIRDMTGFIVTGIQNSESTKPSNNIEQ